MRMVDIMVEDIRKAVEDMIDFECEVIAEKCNKNNGVTLNAVVIKEKGCDAAPAIYVDHILKCLRLGKTTVEDVARYIVDTYMNTRETAKRIADELSSLSKESILERVKYKVVNKEKNSELTEKAPHKEFLDLVALYKMNITTLEGENGGIIVKNEIMTEYGISAEELDEAARRNTKEQSGFYTKTMAKVMSELCGEPEEMLEGPIPMYVLGGEKAFGASIMLYEQYFAELADQMEDDLFVLPSSIHEVLAIPATEGDPAILINMVRDVNGNEVADEEVLSDNVYRYSRRTGKIAIA